MSPSVAIPILTAGQDETREELRELWARLLANGMDPKRRSLIRRSIIDTVRQFDPLDALILSKSFVLYGNMVNLRDTKLLLTGLSVSQDEFELSLVNLKRLECIDSEAMPISFQFTALGREVIRATSL